MKSRAKRTGLFASLGLTLLAVISLAVWLGPTASDNPAEANHSLVVGIDTDASGNSALALGTTQSCRVITFGQIIDVDVYVKGLSDIAAFDSYLKYDYTKIAITKPGDSGQNNNDRFMLQQAQPSPPGNSFSNLSETLPEAPPGNPNATTPGEYSIGGYDSVVIPGVEDPDPIGHTHKDGVLVRLQIQGIGNGFTLMQISPHGPSNGLGFHIKDSTGLINVGDGADSDVFVDSVINGSIVVGSGTCADGDGDGIPDSNDNCAATFNPLQENFDGDSQGDACDADDDNDGLVDASEPSSGCTGGSGGRLDPDCDNDNISDGPNDPDGAGPIVAVPGGDNCITTANTNQLNTDGDAQGNACDPDDDNDGVLDAADNCPVNANSTQTNTDGDSMGDACDLEDDGDGFKDTDEAWVGTNSLDNCGSHTTTPPIYSQTWPADLYSGASFDQTTDRITIADLNSFLAPRRLNTNPGDANYNKRWDLSPGPGIFADEINIQDLSVLLTLRPDMFGGAYAFNGPTCTP